MKRYIEILLVLLITQLAFSQLQDSIIQLTTDIGDTLDSTEKEYYNLYSHYDRFKHLVVFSSGDSCIAIKITYIDSSEVQKDTIVYKDLAFLEILRSQINEIEKKELDENRSNKYSTTQPVIIHLKDGINYQGKLIDVGKDNIVLITSAITSDSINLSLTDTLILFSQDLKSVTIDRSDESTEVLIYSTLGFAALGVIIGFASGDDPPSDEFLNFSFTAGEKATILGILGGVIGFLAGLLFDTEETIDINSAEDLEKLKKYLE